MERDKLNEQYELVRDRARKLDRILESAFEVAENIILGLRVVLYGATVLGAWFYLKDKALAITIAASLTTAHLLMLAIEFIKDKRRELAAP